MELSHIVWTLGGMNTNDTSNDLTADEVRNYYVALINSLVDAGREDEIPALTDQFSQDHARATAARPAA